MAALETSASSESWDKDGLLLLLPEEARAPVLELRERIKDMIETNEDAASHVDAFTLHRYVVARQNNLDDAEAMFRDSHAWRAEVGIGAMMERWQAETKTPEIELATKHAYSTLLEQQTADGSPIIVSRIGRADLVGIVREGMVDLILEQYMVCLESAFRLVTKLSLERKSIVKCMIIMDLAGLSMNTLRYINVVRRVVQIGPPNFAEVTCKINLINAPWVFTSIWAVVKPLLPPATRAKVNICGANYVEQIASSCGGVDMTQLPASFGGEASDDIITFPADPVPVGAGEILKKGEAADDKGASAE